jgi:hypothetical protein
MRRFTKELGSSAILLKGAQAQKWGPETVEIILDMAEGATATQRLSAALPPFLEKFWNGRNPKLIIRGNRKAAPDKLDALRAAPDLQELQSLIPGEFMEYRPGKPTEEPAKAEKGNEEEAGDNLEETGSGD